VVHLNLHLLGTNSWYKHFTEKDYLKIYLPDRVQLYILRSSLQEMDVQKEKMAPKKPDPRQKMIFQSILYEKVDLCVERSVIKSFSENCFTYTSNGHEKPLIIPMIGSTCMIKLLAGSEPNINSCCPKAMCC
jgi:hypothetical protein